MSVRLQCEGLGRNRGLVSAACSSSFKKIEYAQAALRVGEVTACLAAGFNKGSLTGVVVPSSRKRHVRQSISAREAIDIIRQLSTVRCIDMYQSQYTTLLAVCHRG